MHLLSINYKILCHHANSSLFFLFSSPSPSDFKPFVRLSVTISRRCNFKMLFYLHSTQTQTVSVTEATEINFTQHSKAFKDKNSFTIPHNGTTNKSKIRKKPFLEHKTRQDKINLLLLITYSLYNVYNTYKYKWFLIPPCHKTLSNEWLSNNISANLKTNTQHITTQQHNNNQYDKWLKIHFFLISTLHKSLMEFSYPRTQKPLRM